jgi:hypothetical protein
MNVPGEECGELPATVRGHVGIYVDRHPDTGALTVCMSHRMMDAEGTLFAIWYSPEEFRALLALAQQVLAEVELQANT